MKFINIISKYAQPVFWLSFIISLVLLFMPGSAEPGLPYIDKVAHFLLFSWLAFFGLINFKKSFWLVSALIFYSIIAEFIQYYFIPNRDLELMDTVVGMIGILTAVLLSKKFRLKHNLV